jgi:hypothetical protein
MPNDEQPGGRRHRAKQQQITSTLEDPRLLPTFALERALQNVKVFCTRISLLTEYFVLECPC